MCQVGINRQCNAPSIVRTEFKYIIFNVFIKDLFIVIKHSKYLLFAADVTIFLP